MRPDDQDNYDELELRIDVALRSEQPLSVPSGFHTRLKYRLRIADMLQRERRMFRSRMMRMAGFASLVLAVTISLAMYWDVSPTFLQDAPGFMGYLDYLTAAASRIWFVSGNPALLLSLAAVVTTVFVAGTFVGLFQEPKRQ